MYSRDRLKFNMFIKEQLNITNKNLKLAKKGKSHLPLEYLGRFTYNGSSILSIKPNKFKDIIKDSYGGVNNLFITWFYKEINNINNQEEINTPIPPEVYNEINEVIDKYINGVIPYSDIWSIAKHEFNKIKKSEG